MLNKQINQLSTIKYQLPITKMILAENPYIVPVSDQEPDSFTVPIQYQPHVLNVKLPLSANGTLAVLRPLANHLGLGHMLSSNETKERLIKLITPNLSLLPMADAIARWPQLDESIPITFAEVKDVLNCFMEGEWAATLRHETPQFIPHLHRRIIDCKKVYDMLEYEEQKAECDWQELRQRLQKHGPAWCMEVCRNPPVDGKHYVITVTMKGHGEEFHNKVFYLPIQSGWTQTDIPIGQEWIMQDECDCCGMPQEKWHVSSCE